MRRRFALTVLAVTTMVTLAFSVPFAAVIKTVAADQALIAADREAQSLAGVLGASASPSELASYVTQLNAGSADRATVILPGGERIGATNAIPSDDLSVARSGRAFTASWAGGTDVLVPVQLSGSRVSVGVVEVPDALLHHGVLLAWLILALVSIAIVALGVLLADRLGRSLVASVRGLGAVTARLQRGDLSARVELAGPPEVREVGETVNTLAGRIVDMLEHERETSADLSHRLRTPLMVLQLEAERIADVAERERVTRAIGELTEAVSDVIRSARGERSAGGASDLREVAAERLAFWSVLATEQGRRWSAELADGPLVVAVDPEALAATLDALLTNVFAHTAEGVGFTVRASATAEGAMFVIEDDGVGFDPRLVPARGRSGVGSTGLGLDIVAQSARASGGELALGESASGGASVTVRFGAPVNSVTD